MDVASGCCFSLSVTFPCSKTVHYTDLTSACRGECHPVVTLPWQSARNQYNHAVTGIAFRKRLGLPFE